MTPGISEKKLSSIIGNLLRLGVVSAATIVLAGGVWFLMTTGSLNINYSLFRGEPDRLRTFHGILSGLASGDSRVLIQLGLLVLIATPVARVALSLVAFVVQKDWLYVVITAIVLIALSFSLAGG